MRPALIAVLVTLTVACAPAAAPSPTAVPAKPTEQKPAAPAPTTAAAPASTGSTTAPAATTAPAKPAQLIPVKSLFTTTAAVLTPQWVAKDAGFFEEEGLDVSLTRIQSGAPALAAMQSGEVPIAAIGGQNIVDSSLKGADFVLVGGIVARLQGTIYVHPSIEVPEQLKGKVIGVTNFGSSSHVSATAGAERMGIKDQVTFIATGGPPETVASMQAGQIQAGLLGAPESLRARQLGYRPLIDVTSLNIPTQILGVATTRKFARENPDIVERYLIACVKATHKAYTDREAAMRAIAKYSGVEERELLEETYNDNAVWTQDLFPSLPGLQYNLNLAMETIPDARGARPEQFVDMSFVEKIKASGLIEQLWGKQ